MLNNLEILKRFTSDLRRHLWLVSSVETIFGKVLQLLTGQLQLMAPYSWRRDLKKTCQAVKQPWQLCGQSASI